MSNFIYTCIFLVGCLSYAQTARLQVIHNSPDLAVQTVDIYVNGVMFIDNFQFRTATEFRTVPAGVPLSIDVTPGNSTSASQSLYNLTTTLFNGDTYIAFANGIISTTGYTNPSSFTLALFSPVRESASVGSETDILVHHGSPDTPTLDIVDNSVPPEFLIDDITFTNSAGYLELPTLDFSLDVQDASGTTTVATYLVPLQTLNLDGAAITILTSGFLNPSNNSNGPAFGLWVATALGGNLIQLPTAPLSISDFNSDTIKIYPNPANTILNIDVPFSYEVAKVTIIDLNGRTILNSTDKINTVDVTGLTDGVYLLSLQLDDTIINRKIVIAN